jgi:hypothetical protein
MVYSNTTVGVGGPWQDRVDNGDSRTLDAAMEPRRAP